MKLLTTVLTAAIASSAVASVFTNGETVVFFGDSITHGGRYHWYVADFYRTRHPDAKIRFVNSGIGGDTALAAQPRIPVDVAEYNPTCVAFHFGMNDVGRGCYTDRPELKLVELADELQAAYRRNLKDLVAKTRAAAPSARHVYLTPTPYDDVAVVTNMPKGASGWATVCQKGCDAGLMLMAGHVAAQAKKDGALLVDWYTPLRNFLAGKQAKDPHFMITGWDRVHPGALGHSIMAWKFLEAQGVDPVVSEVAIDVDTSVSNRVVNAEMSGLEASADGVSFTLVARALPMPVAAEALPYVDEFRVAEKLNRETVKVSGLAEGRYSMRIDGAEVGEYSAVELAKGVNLAFNARTPQYRQAQEVAAKGAALGERERLLRNHHSARWAFSRKAPVDDVAAFAKWMDEHPAEKRSYFAKFVPGYLEYWPKYREVRGELLAEQEKVREFAKPRAHRYEISRGR